MTDHELQLALAKMLPEKIFQYSDGHPFYWKDDINGPQLRASDWLHACWLIERYIEIGYDGSEAASYQEMLWRIVNPSPNTPFTERYVFDVAFLFRYLNASWKQRAEALIKVKGNA